MFFSSAVLFVINKLVSAWLATESVSGIFHCSGGAFLKLTVNRSCDNETLPLSPRFTFTTGNPGCSVQLAAISPTGFPEASASAFQRSAVVELEYLCAAM